MTGHKGYSRPSLTTYSEGCRCADCRAVVSAYQRARKAGEQTRGRDWLAELGEHAQHIRIDQAIARWWPRTSRIMAATGATYEEVQDAWARICEAVAS